MKMTKKSAGKSYAFRLPAEDEAAICALAAAANLSVGELARLMLIERVHAGAQSSGAGSLLSQRLLQKLEELNGNLRFTALAMLVECGDAEPEEVEALLSEHWK
jgi:hypothetical protein